MTECCNYCKIEITKSDATEVLWKINLLNSQKNEEFKKEQGLICSTCLEVYFNKSEKIKA
jgi:hypothetical protein|tara:strand:- start:67 stop:246 length:180 start_codon:yes stop_codon:yes gene_type:complete